MPSSSPFKLRLNYRNSLWMLEKNLPGAVGRFRAAVRLAIRKGLDWCAALVYLLTGKLDYARAVRDAHREVRRSGKVVFKGKYKAPPSGGLLIIKYLQK